MTTKVNNVNVKEASANAKANQMLYKDMFANFKKEISGQIPTSLGLGRQDLYKKSVMEGLNERQQKAQRKKIRDIVYNVFLGIIAAPNNEKLINNFVEFYKATYVLNDFSFASVASENTKEEKKEVIKKALEIVKKHVNK